MNITRLTKDDLPSLAELFTQFWGEVSSIERMKSSFSKISNNPAYVLLAAKQNEKLIGFGMGVICWELYGDCKPFMVVEDLIVHMNQRRSGVGSGLMRKLEEVAIEIDCCQVIFVTEAERTEACRFYRTLGYEFVPYRGFKRKLETANK
ncbi:MAG: GNAT family N-acetyltransferase [Pseudomonadota bacterium]